MFGENSIKSSKNYNTIAPQYSTMNTAAYQNNDQVDWGALAKQWIQMATDLVPAAPPPIFIKDFEEKGEAPMEVEKDDELQTISPTDTTNWPSPGWNQAFPNHGQWRPGWNTWTNPNMVPAPQLNTPCRPPLLPQPNSFTTFNTTNLQSPDYWTYKPRFPLTETVQVQSSKENDIRTETIENNDEDIDEDTTQTIDAAKRKILPAWLREGLEKMEREKQKLEEKEKDIRAREKMLLQRRIEEEEVLKELEKDSLIQPTKSKFESDSEDNEEEKIVTPIEIKRTEKQHTKSDQFEEKKLSKSPELIIPYRTRDEIIQDIMLSVRKNLTEILLEVTNEEILDISKECLAKARKKAPTTALRKTALTSLTGGLGLGIYDNSTDESDSSSDEGDKQNNNDDDNDSEQELQELIKRRKAAFEKTSREIEALIAADEEREERLRREHEEEHRGNEEKKTEDDGRRRIHHDRSSNSGDYKDGETQLHDKNNMKYGRSAREKKPTRFSDPRDTVKNVQTHVSIVTPNKSTYKNENEKKSTSYRRSCDSSNSSSNESSTTNSRSRKSKKNKKPYKRNRTKYEGSDNSDSTNDDNHSILSTSSHKIPEKSRRSRSRDHYSRSEDSRSSYRRDRSRSRDHSKRSRDHRHRYKRESRDYYDDRSRSTDKKRNTKSRSRERYYSKNNNKETSETRSKDKKSSSRHRY